MRKVAVDKQTVEEIQNLFNEYPSIKKKDICEKFGISNDVLRRIIEEYSISTHRDDFKTDLSEDDIECLKKMFEESDVTLNDICKALNCSYSIMLKYIYSIYGKSKLDERKSKLYAISKTGSNNPSSLLKRECSTKWKGGHPDDGNGYSLAFNDGWIVDRPYDKYVFEHHLIMLKALHLHKMPHKGVIHHINHQRKDNDIDNLVLLSNGGHARLHSLERTARLSPTFNDQMDLNSYINWLGLSSIPVGFELFHIDGNPNNWQLNNIALLTSGARNHLCSVLNRKQDW